MQVRRKPKLLPALVQQPPPLVTAHVRVSGCMQVAVQEVRRLQKYGVTSGELERYKAALIRDSEHVAEQWESVPSVDTLDYCMECLALNHTFMAQEDVCYLLLPPSLLLRPSILLLLPMKGFAGFACKLCIHAFGVPRLLLWLLQPKTFFLFLLYVAACSIAAVTPRDCLQPAVYT